MSNAKRRGTRINYSEAKFECVACKASFQYNSALKKHIRRLHFQLVGHVPYAETQEIDQVWYEKVVNTDAIVRMKKVSENVIIIQKIKDPPIPTEIISKEQQEQLDVQEIYPMNSRKITNVLECKVCQKSFGRRLLGKHFAECHADLVKDRCDVCKMKLKRAFTCARHVCPEFFQ